jgi:hypothetical protein
MRLRVVLSAVLALAFGVLASTSFASQRSTAAALSPQAVLDWNTHAWTVVSQAQHPREVTPPATRNLFQVEGMLYMTYTQAAVYDAVVAIEGRYEPYGFSLFAPDGASPDAAVAQAAHDVLSYYLAPWLTPAQVMQLDTWLSDSLAPIPDGQSKTDGVSVGRAAAQGIIAIRTNDGRDGPEGTFGTGPIVAGSWVLTPGPFPFAQTPWIGTMHPFMLKSTSQFRPAPPPALNSSKYAKDLNEVKAYGSVNSTFRTADETKTAYFWNANGPNQYNDAFRGVITQHGMDLVDAARLLAMGDLPSRTPAWPASTPSTPICSGGRSRRSSTPTLTAIRGRTLTGAGRLSSRRPTIRNTPRRTGASRARSLKSSRKRYTRITSTCTSKAQRTVSRP